MKHCLLLLICTASLAAVGNCQEDQSSSPKNFQLFDIRNGWSVELPTSWKTSRELNQQFSEFQQAGADNFSQSFSGSNAGQVKNYLFSAQRMAGDLCSLTISVMNSPQPWTQSQMSVLTAEEKKQTCAALTSLVAKQLTSGGQDPNSGIAVDFIDFNGKHTLSTCISEPSGKKMLTIQIPSGNEILMLNFVLKDMDLWGPIIKRIVGSVNLPH